VSEKSQVEKKSTTEMESEEDCPHCGEEIVVEVACYHGSETVLRYTIRKG
jgi:formate dehydrogenase maturation protein FdhE